MATWSTRRKSTYAAIFIVLIVIVIGVPSFFVFYKAPTCSDGLKNGNEGGVDCGGACEKLCSSSFLPIPPAQWVRYKEISQNVYNAAAYIINPNHSGTASDVPYKIELIDKDGVTIATGKGTVTIPPGRNTLAFSAGISTGTQKPVRAVFTFTGEPDWIVENDPLKSLETSSKDYTEEGGGSALSVTFTNNGVKPVSNLAVYAVLRDKDSNVVDFSKTYIDEVRAHDTATAPFTWPVSHNGEVISIEVLPVAE